MNWWPQCLNLSKSIIGLFKHLIQSKLCGLLWAIQVRWVLNNHLEFFIYSKIQIYLTFCSITQSNWWTTCFTSIQLDGFTANSKSPANVGWTRWDSMKLSNPWKVKIIPLNNYVNISLDLYLSDFSKTKYQNTKKL